MWQPESMVQPRSIILFMSGVGFTLAVVLSCNSRGHITPDANVADASPPSVADASPDDAGSQTCCSSITVSGVTKTVSAENDPSQLRSAVIPVQSGSNGTVLSGPFVITNISQNFAGAPGVGVVTTQLYYSATPCTYAAERQVFVVLPASTGAGGLSGRFWLPAGTNLCYYAISSSGGVDTGFLSYSGFAPY